MTTLPTFSAPWTVFRASPVLAWALVVPVLLTDPVLGASITVLQPDGVDDVVAEGRDYATWELGNPWDMEDSTGERCPERVWDDLFECDVVIAESGEILGEGFTGDGLYTGTAAGTDPRAWLVHPGLKSVVKLANGALFPIDPSIYRRFSAKARFTGSQLDPPLDAAPMVVLFAQGLHLDTDPFGQTDAAKTGRVPPDLWSIVEFDLSSETDGSRSSWDDFDSWPGLRVDPTNEVGVTFELDWLRLVSSGGPENELTVSWTASDTGPDTFAVELIDAGGAVFRAVEGLPPQTRETRVDLSPLPPGDYTVRVVSSSGTHDESCSGCATIDAAPILRLTDPDKAGAVDRDYATAEADPWGPFEADDVESFGVAPGSEEFLGGVYSARNPAGDRDPRSYLRTPTPIDTQRYRALSYRFEVEGTRDIGAGSVARILWGNDRTALETSDDIVIEEGAVTYVPGDLANVPVEGGILGRWVGSLEELRFDPHEFLTSRTWHLEWIELAPYDEADPLFELSWQAEDPDSVASIDLFSDSDRSPGNGNEELIVGSLTEGTDSSYSWDTTGAQPGLRWIYGEIADGLTTMVRYAGGPLVVYCDPALFPDLTVTSPAPGKDVDEVACGTIRTQVYEIPSDSRVHLRATTIEIGNGFVARSGSLFTAANDRYLALPLP